MYKMMKVFDSQDMPEDVRTFFFETSQHGNDCHISHEVFTKTYWDEAEDGNEVEVVSEESTIVDGWLLENGAIAGEYVLIKHWW